MAAQGGAGVLQGATTPTTGDDQFLKNIATDAVLGAGTDGLVRGAGAVVPKLAGAAMPKVDQALVDAGHAQGLPVRLMDVSPGWKQLAEGMPTNGSITTAREQADSALTKKIAEGVGLNDYTGQIDSNFLNTARQPIKTALDNATNVSIVLPESMRADLQNVVAKSANPLTDGIADSSVVTKAINNLTKAIDNKTAVSGVDLQGLNSELKDLLHNPNISSSQKQVASNLIDKINGTLNDAMTPEQAAAYKLANSQYANLKAVERMVRTSNDSGVVTPRQIVMAAKTGTFKNSFLKGEAPYQDLGTTAASLYGPANGKGIGDIIAKAAGGHDEAMIAAAILHPHVGIPTYLVKKAAQAVLGKLATREIAPSAKGLAAKALESSVAPAATVAATEAAPSIEKSIATQVVETPAAQEPVKAAPLALTYTPKTMQSRAAHAVIVDSKGNATAAPTPGIRIAEKHAADRANRVDNETIARALAKSYPDEVAPAAVVDAKPVGMGGINAKPTADMSASEVMATAPKAHTPIPDGPKQTPAEILASLRNRKAGKAIAEGAPVKSAAEKIKEKVVVEEAKPVVELTPEQQATQEAKDMKKASNTKMPTLNYSHLSDSMIDLSLAKRNLTPTVRRAYEAEQRTRIAKAIAADKAAGHGK